MLANKGFSFMGCRLLWKIFFECINDKETGSKINITGSVRDILFCKFNAIYSMKNLQKYNNLHLLLHPYLKKKICYQSFFFFLPQLLRTIVEDPKSHLWLQSHRVRTPPLSSLMRSCSPLHADCMEWLKQMAAPPTF